MIWSKRLAPYQLALLALTDKRSPEVLESAERLYQQLSQQGFEVLFDDREESPGVKFKDADLIGLPLRLTLGKRGLERGVAEVKWRNLPERFEVPLGEVPGYSRHFFDS
jgi:prolyl-tRNA synthetase